MFTLKDIRSGDRVLTPIGTGFIPGPEANLPISSLLLAGIVWVEMDSGASHTFVVSDISVIARDAS